MSTLERASHLVESALHLIERFAVMDNAQDHQVENVISPSANAVDANIQQVASPLIYRTQLKKKNWDRCNICMNMRKLSDDHLPPQGATVVTEVEVKSLQQQWANDPKHFRSAFSQNGLKFKTICRECNSKLGSNYDHELIRFTSHIRRTFNSILTIPETSHIEVNPDRIIRAVVGHLIAAKVEPDGVDDKARAYLADEVALPPPGLNVFYWIYPFEPTVVVRDILMPAVRGDFGKGFGFFSVLKYYPLGFALADIQSYEGLENLANYAVGNLWQQVHVPIHLKHTRPLGWPESPTNGNFTIMGKAGGDSVTAMPTKPSAIYRP